MPRSKEELLTHINKYKDAVIIVGNGIYEDFEIDNEEFNNSFNKKNFKRNNVAFWRYFIDNFSKDYTTDIFRLLVKNTPFREIYDFNIVGPTQGVSFRGCSGSLTCQKCGTVYSKKYVRKDNNEKVTCEICDGLLKPDMLFSNESFNQDIYNKLIDDINNTHTLILLGVDFTEEFILKIIDEYGISKTIFNSNSKTDEMKILVTLVNDNETFDINELTYSEFVVKGNIENSLKRLFI